MSYMYLFFYKNVLSCLKLCHWIMVHTCAMITMVFKFMNLDNNLL